MCTGKKKSKLRKRHTLAIYGQAGCTAGHFLLLQDADFMKKSGETFTVL